MEQLNCKMRIEIIILLQEKCEKLKIYEILIIRELTAVARLAMMSIDTWSSQKIAD